MRPAGRIQNPLYIDPVRLGETQDDEIKLFTTSGVVTLNISPPFTETTSPAQESERVLLLSKGGEFERYTLHVIRYAFQPVSLPICCL